MAMTKEQALALASAQLRLQQQEQTKTPEQPGFIDKLGRATGIQGKALIEGALSLPGMATDALRYVAQKNAPPPELAQQLGMRQPYSGPSSAQNTNTLLTNIGLPEPQNDVERLFSAGAKGIGAAASGMGLGNVLSSAASPVVSGVGNILRSAPASQVVAGGAAGASSELARQQGAGPIVQTLAGFAGGLGAGVLGQRLLPQGWNPNYMGTAPQARNETVKEATLREAQQEGYVVSPAATTGNAAGKVLSGLSGKAKTEQLARIKNQEITDSLAKRSIGLTPDAQLTPENIQNVRAQAYQQGYAPIAQAGQMQTDNGYRTALNAIRRNYAGQNSSFPAAVRQDIVDTLDSVNVNNFDSADAVTQIKLLREQAKGAFSGANPDATLGRAYREMSTAIEDQIQRNIQNQGTPQSAQLLNNFRNARQLIARAHTVEDALIEGGGTVDAAKIARELQKGAPLTGELRTIGSFANNFKESARLPSSADANALTVLDFTTMGAGAGVSGMSGGAGVPLMLLPPTRVAARYGILSGPGQRMFTTPNLNAPTDTVFNPFLLPSYTGSQR